MLRLPPIKLVSPTTVQAAAKAVAASGDNARLVAGGTDLWPNMKRRHQKAETVVSLMSIPDLDSIDSATANIRIGATASLANIIRDDKVRARFPAFAGAVPRYHLRHCAIWAPSAAISASIRVAPITIRPKNGVVR